VNRFGDRETTSRQCPYCDGVFAVSTGSGSPVWDHVLWANESVVVIPTRGALVEGWLLAIPREHVLASRELSGVQADDLRTAVEWAKIALGRHYGSVAVFEHGAARPGTVVGCGVDHAHIHVVPLDFDLVDAARNHPIGNRLDWERFPSWEAVYSSVRQTQPYLAVQTDGPDVWVGRGDIPSQFFRRIIASEIGRPDAFDWRDDPRTDQAQRTIVQLTRGSDHTDSVATVQARRRSIAAGV
jgi:ATP adenylyltransferase